jgi:hypothetical protein
MGTKAIDLFDPFIEPEIVLSTDDVLVFDNLCAMVFDNLTAMTADQMAVTVFLFYDFITFLWFALTAIRH